MIRFIAGVVVATFVAFLYVHQEIESAKLGYAIRKKEQTYVRLLDKSKSLQYNIARFKAPAQLESSLISKQVTLSAPAQMQIVKWKGEEETRAASAAVSQNAAQRFFARLLSVTTAYAQAKGEAGVR